MSASSKSACNYSPRPGPTSCDRLSRGGRVFLDLKYHDIPNTVAAAGVEATRLGVSIFNIHASGGSEMMKRTADAVAETAAREGLTKPTVIGVTLITSVDQETLRQIGIDDEPPSVIKRLTLLAQTSGLDGVVASAHEIKIIREAVPRSGFVIVTPGMRSAGDSADDQRRFMSLRHATTCHYHSLVHKKLKFSLNLASVTALMICLSGVMAAQQTEANPTP